MYFLSDFCQNEDALEIILVSSRILKLLFTIIPIILILMISIDFAKSVISNSEDNMKKQLNIAIKRIIYCIAIFLIPYIVSSVINVFSDSDIKLLDCITNATEEKISYYRKLHQSEDYKSASSKGNTKKSASSKKDKNKDKSKDNKQSNNYKLGKSTVVIGQGKDHWVFEYYTIVIKDKNGKVVSNNNFNFTSKNPGIASVTSAGKITAKFGGQTTIRITSKNNSSQALNQRVVVIHSLYVKAKVKSTINAKNLATGKTETLKSGTTGTLNGTYYKTTMNGNILKVGTKYYSVSTNNLTPIDYAIDAQYSRSVVEAFVNSYGFTSNTKYLFWTNQGTQRNYRFIGSKGKWKLQKVYKVSTGDVLGKHNHPNHPRTDIAPYLRVIGSTTTRFGTNDNNVYNGFRAIWKTNPLNGNGTNPWHTGHPDPVGDEPRSNGCTRFSKNDIGSLFNEYSKIKGSSIIDY